ncbi:MAG: Gfo/Idh/MocA family oxidoreductase [Candidatus Latescibacteria bacterium]|nr:Gfo/Idh/MocA family oxidoreductase [Candidatus Latescibacterota bacterium]
MKPEKVNVAVIGVGNMGRHHVRAYSELAEANLTAVSDLNGQLGKETVERFHLRFYLDYREMLEKEEIDAVSVVVPTATHKEVALDCIQRGKAVLIEKPLADSTEAGKQIMEQAGKRGVTVLVGHIERFNPAVLRLKDLLEEGKLERITSIIARRVGISPPQLKEANVIVDLAVHDIDVCNFLLGKTPQQVYARAGKALNSQRADFASIFLDYNGTDVLIQANWITPVKIRELNVTGTKGYAELDYITQKLKLYESNYRRGFDSFGDFIVRFATPNIREVAVKTAEPLKMELKHFLACVKGQEKPLVSGKDGLNALKIALCAVQSWEEGEVIGVDTAL